jgi:hypothetical protein
VDQRQPVRAEEEVLLRRVTDHGYVRRRQLSGLRDGFLELPQETALEAIPAVQGRRGELDVADLVDSP